jgi:hypothetical protein
MMADIFCPIHKEVSQRIDSITSIQGSRHCGSHEAQIGGLQDDVARIDYDNREQWVAINNLRRLVYMGAGGVSMAAFLGSILGNVLVNMMKKGGTP